MLQQLPNANAGANVEVRMLETFLRNQPPTFKGRYNPDGAQTWLKEIERVFRVMQCTKVQKVRFGTHMLAKEVDDCGGILRGVFQNFNPLCGRNPIEMDLD